MCLCEQWVGSAESATIKRQNMLVKPLALTSMCVPPGSQERKKRKVQPVEVSRGN